MPLPRHAFLRLRCRFAAACSSCHAAIAADAALMFRFSLRHTPLRCRAAADIRHAYFAYAAMPLHYFLPCRHAAPFADADTEHTRHALQHTLRAMLLLPQWMLPAPCFFSALIC